jgi:hypothetical protein
MVIPMLNSLQACSLLLAAEDVKNLAPDIYGNLSNDPISKPK